MKGDNAVFFWGFFLGFNVVIGLLNMCIFIVTGDITNFVGLMFNFFAICGCVYFIKENDNA